MIRTSSFWIVSTSHTQPVLIPVFLCVRVLKCKLGNGILLFYRALPIKFGCTQHSLLPGSSPIDPSKWRCNSSFNLQPNTQFWGINESYMLLFVNISPFLVVFKKSLATPLRTWDVSYLIRGLTHAAYIRSPRFNHGTAREVPSMWFFSVGSGTPVHYLFNVSSLEEWREWFD